MKIWTVVLSPFQTNCYIVTDGESGRAAVIDPGTDDPEIGAVLARENLAADTIFLTHGHFDHVLGVESLRAETGARVVIHTEDAPCLTDRGKMMAHNRSQPIPDAHPADVLASDGDIFTVGGLTFEWLHTPGHTVGSSVLLCSTGAGSRCLFTGDTLFARECGRCDLPGGDFEQMLKSLRRLAELPGDYDIYPGHNMSSRLSVERAENPYVLQALSG